jgi:hypothetical protein
MNNRDECSSLPANQRRQAHNTAVEGGGASAGTLKQPKNPIFFAEFPLLYASKHESEFANFKIKQKIQTNIDMFLENPFSKTKPRYVTKTKPYYDTLLKFN